MFEGDTGRVATWADLVEGISWSQVVFLGEIHDHREGHQVQVAIVEDMLAATPGTAVSLEMFERNEQPIVDAYLRGELEEATLVERTGSASWAPKNSADGSWSEFYQPLVDRAKEAGSPVIAANAPRVYVRQARIDGYDALNALPPEERSHFDLPKRLDDGAYRQRFNAVMTPEGEDPADPARLASLDQTFRSQQMWDATMARSIATALDDGAPKVVHCLGSFHSDYRGGTVLALRDAKPFVRILTVSIVPEAATALRERDRGRADIVIYAPRETPHADRAIEVDSAP